MIKTIITIACSLILNAGNSQTDFLKVADLNLLFCGTTASDTNSFVFLKKSYEKTLEFIGNDSLLVLLEISEDDIFIQRHESDNTIFYLYELIRYGENGQKLEKQYSKFYSNVIRYSKFHPNIILRGFRNPIQHNQIFSIRKYYPDLISNKDSTEIAFSLSEKVSISKDLFDKLTSKLNAIKIDPWEKAYIGTWIDELSGVHAGEIYPYQESYWDSVLLNINNRIILSPYEQIEDNYTPLYLRKYFSNPTKIILYRKSVVLTHSNKYRILTNKKYKSLKGFDFISTEKKINLYSNSKNKFRSQLLISGNYFGDW